MEEERSAGGVIFSGKQVLVLRNFRGEYIFPKGHIEPDESQLAAALREVAEEAGLHPVVMGPISDTAYRYRLADGSYREKRVSWFLMEVKEQALAVDGLEIKWGKFLPVAAALQLLTHSLDRELLEQVAGRRAVPNGEGPDA